MDRQGRWATVNIPPVEIPIHIRIPRSVRTKEATPTEFLGSGRSTVCGESSDLIYIYTGSYKLPVSDLAEL